MNAPIDETHAASVAYIRRIRERYALAREAIARWQPRPMPPDWRPR